MQQVFQSAKGRGTLFVQKTGNPIEDNKLKWLTSEGVTYKHTGPDTQPIKGYVEAVEKEMHLLSTDCKNALLKIGRLVDDDEPVGQDANNCNDQMEALISGLQREFRSVQLLPVSAQGKPADNTDGGQRSEGVTDQENLDIHNLQDHDDHVPASATYVEPRSMGEVLRGKLGHPQKFSEFLILGPVMMLVKKHWLSSSVHQTLD
jgi:hypothetical protein